MDAGLELRELDAYEFLANLDACTSVYAAAMGPPEYQLPGRRTIMERHARFAGFRAIAALRPVHAPAPGTDLRSGATPNAGTTDAAARTVLAPSSTTAGPLAASSGAPDGRTSGGRTRGRLIADGLSTDPLTPAGRAGYGRAADGGAARERAVDERAADGGAAGERAVDERAADGGAAGGRAPDGLTGDGPAVPGLGANGQLALAGFAYGFHGENGQWWHDLVAHAVRGTLGQQAASDWLSDCLEIAEVHVHPGYQGRGTGLAMLLRLTEGRPERTALLSTMDANTRARRLYRGLGFTDLLANFAFAGTEEPYAIMGAPLPLPGAASRPDKPSFS